MEAHLKVIFFISIGGITMFLPYIFIEKKGATIKLFAWLLLFSVGLSVFFSVIVAFGGNCNFFETLLMEGERCRNFPFAKASTVPATNGMAFTSFILLVIAVIKKFVFKILFRDKNAL